MSLLKSFVTPYAKLSRKRSYSPCDTYLITTVKKTRKLQMISEITEIIIFRKNLLKFLRGAYMPIHVTAVYSTNFILRV